MTSPIIAYSFLKASYGASVSESPLDSILPLVKRGLMKSGSTQFRQIDVQTRIRDLFGLTIPLNVIRYTFPTLAREKILVLNPNTHIYELIDKNYNDPEVDNLERIARQQYKRVVRAIEQTISDNNIPNLDGNGVIEDWLDNSSLSFLGGINPAFGAGMIDTELNRVMLLTIKDPRGGSDFLTDITEIALGDALFQAIKSVTEHDSDELIPPHTQLKSHMSSVSVYLDTPLVLRVLGWSNNELVQGAAEFMSLCKATKCNLCIYDHSIREIMRIIRATASSIVLDDEAQGDIAQYAAARGLKVGDILDLNVALTAKLAKIGITIAPAPPLTEANKELSIDESALRTKLQIDLKQKNDDAINADVDSLSATYRLRRGRGKKYLSECDAIFITTNKGLSDSAFSFFKTEFSERKEPNQVQLCMTDVVFSSRLWVKLPTSIDKLPRQQIIVHILSNLKPSLELKASFVRYLKDYVAKGRVKDTTAAKILLSGFVDQILATDFETRKTSLDVREFETTTQRALNMLNANINRRIENITKEERDKLEMEFAEEINLLEQSRAKSHAALSDKIGEYEKELAILKAKNETIEMAHENAKPKIRSVIRLITIILAFFIMFILVSSLLSDWIGGVIKVNFGQGRAETLKVIIFVLNFILTAFMTVLGFYGLSVSGIASRAENAALKKLLKMLFG